jgi:hypothetical protein
VTLVLGGPDGGETPTDAGDPVSIRVRVPVIGGVPLKTVLTATQKAGLVQDTPWRSAVSELPPGLGLEAMDQLVPFQVSTRVLPGSWDVGPPKPPTATQWVVLVQDTPWRLFGELVGPGLGLGVSDQLVPFQTSARVRDSLNLLLWPPTATQWVALVQDTPSRVLPPLPGSGLGVIDQSVGAACASPT